MVTPQGIQPFGTSEARPYGKCYEAIIANSLPSPVYVRIMTLFMVSLKTATQKP